MSPSSVSIVYNRACDSMPTYLGRYLRQEPISSGRDSALIDGEFRLECKRDLVAPAPALPPSSVYPIGLQPRLRTARSRYGVSTTTLGTFSLPTGLARRQGLGASTTLTDPYIQMRCRYETGTASRRRRPFFALLLGHTPQDAISDLVQCLSKGIVRPGHPQCWIWLEARPT